MTIHHFSITPKGQKDRERFHYYRVAVQATSLSSAKNILRGWVEEQQKKERFSKGCYTDKISAASAPHPPAFREGNVVYEYPDIEG